MSGAINVSGTKRPPYRPQWPSESGCEIVVFIRKFSRQVAKKRKERQSITRLSNQATTVQPLLCGFAAWREMLFSLLVNISQTTQGSTALLSRPSWARLAHVACAAAQSFASEHSA